MSSILIFLKEFTFFALVARVLLQMRPKEAYEKYLRLLVSVMMLSMVMEYVLEGGLKWIWELF